LRASEVKELSRHLMDHYGISAENNAT
jgi:hypothetical protein